jgi:hypothetical protein
MQMQDVSMSEATGMAHRKVTISVAIGRYNFIDGDGWHHEWITETPREWWQKQQWIRDGGYSQDGPLSYQQHYSQAP